MLLEPSLRCSKILGRVLGALTTSLMTPVASHPGSLNRVRHFEAGVALRGALGVNEGDGSGGACLVDGLLGVELIRAPPDSLALRRVMCPRMTRISSGMWTPSGAFGLLSRM